MSACIFFHTKTTIFGPSNVFLWNYRSAMIIMSPHVARAKYRINLLSFSCCLGVCKANLGLISINSLFPFLIQLLLFVRLSLCFSLAPLWCFISPCVVLCTYVPFFFWSHERCDYINILRSMIYIYISYSCGKSRYPSARASFLTRTQLLQLPLPLRPHAVLL